MPRLRNSTARFKLLLLFVALFSVWPTGSPALDYEKCVKVLGEDSLTLDEGEFDAVIADILLSDGVEGPMSAALVDRPEPKLSNSLRQNFPNPFNPETTIIYSVKVAGKVTLAVYDVAGRRVRQLVDANRMPGNYRVIWDGTDSQGNRAASGIYFSRLVTGSFSASKKMVMLK